MSSPSPTVRFTVNGQRFELTRDLVDARLRDVTPEPARKHIVRVNDIWYPVKQALEAATGLPRGEFISHAARRHLAALGYEVRGDIESRTDPIASTPPSSPSSAQANPPATATDEWHTEANVQAVVVASLVRDGWRVLSVANTATREHGIDVLAARDDATLGVEVKGFPSRNYADPARAGEPKRTSPSTQAGHWYGQAVLAAMRLRGREPQWRSVVALPDFPRYRDLYAETKGSLAAAGIEVWWTTVDGEVKVAG